MQHRSQYRDTNLDKSESNICLAEILSNDHSFQNDVDDTVISPDQASEAFAVGRYRAKTIKPTIQYFDCDFKSVCDFHLKGVVTPSLWLGVFFQGGWSNTVNGKEIELGFNNIPASMGFSETTQVIENQKTGNSTRMASILIDAKFFEDDSTNNADNSLEPLSQLMQPNGKYKEYNTSGTLKKFFQQMFFNPYHGRMSQLYMESLALSAMVELSNIVAESTRERLFYVQKNVELAYEARRIIEMNLSSIILTSELATRLGTNETTLRRIFKAEFGITIMEYARDQRLQAARIMLREGKLQIAAIAYRIGYSDPANFTAAYKRHFGYPPKLEQQ